FEELTEPIARYEGTVVRLLGDAILAFFGAPVSHEDDPRRAVLAALEMMEAMPDYRERVKKDYGFDFNIRIGMKTGVAVVGEIGSSVVTEYNALGEGVKSPRSVEHTPD